MSCSLCNRAIEFAAKLNLENNCYMDFFEKVIHAKNQNSWESIEEAIDELAAAFEQEDLEEQENVAELSDEPTPYPVP